MEKEKELIAGYEFKNNDSDQIWVDKYLFYKNPDGSFQKEFKSGWSPKFDSTESITQEEVLSEMEKATNSVGKYKRGGYRITKAIQSIEDSKKWEEFLDDLVKITPEDAADAESWGITEKFSCSKCSLAAGEENLYQYNNEWYCEDCLKKVIDAEGGII